MMAIWTSSARTVACQSCTKFIDAACSLWQITCRSYGKLDDMQGRPAMCTLFVMTHKKQASP